MDDAGPALAGVIAAVAPGPAAIGVTVDLAEEGGEAVLLVSPETEVEVLLPDGSVKRGGAADLVAGARIAARHTGAEMRSLPPQYHATHVRVEPGR